MSDKPTYKQLQTLLSESQGVVHALRGRQVDAVVADDSVVMLRLREAEQELRRAYEEMERQVAERTAQLRSLVLELSHAEERERRRLGQVLHDNLQQLLVAAKLHLNSLTKPAVDPRLRQSAEEVQALLVESIQVTRELSAELNPRIVHEEGLKASLQWLKMWMREKHGLTVSLRTDGDGDVRHEDMRILLFQCVRELLFNVVKHAGVDCATVRLTSDQQGHLRIRVADEGRGFDVGAVHQSRHGVMGGLGLFSIRERLGVLGASLRIVSAPDAGSEFTIVVPVEATGRAPAPA